MIDPIAFNALARFRGRGTPDHHNLAPFWYTHVWFDDCPCTKRGGELKGQIHERRTPWQRELSVWESTIILTMATI